MYAPQIPHGPKGFICPLLNKDMSKCCHTCPLWVQIRGKNPQSFEEIDKWNCSLAFLPMLLIENSQMSRQTGAAVESFRNEVVRRSVVPARPKEVPLVNHFQEHMQIEQS